MTKNSAIQGFFESFGLSAFPSVSVPTSGDEKPDFPYLTYTVNTDQGIERVGCTASLWYRSDGWKGLNDKVDEISQMIGNGIVLYCDEGGIIIRKGTPWAQPMGDDIDNMIKRKILTFEFLFATTY